MDYEQAKQAIDGMKWVRSPEELELEILFLEAQSRQDWNVAGRMAQKLSERRAPLIEAGLQGPVFYAFQARAAWEMLGLADERGEGLREEYNLHPAGQSGIGLDWHKLNERVWIPADYLEATIKPKNSRAIFSHDEVNCIFTGSPDKNDEKLVRAVIRGPDEYGSSEAKIDALLKDPEWRRLAIDYSLRLLYHAGKKNTYVKGEFRPVLEALIHGYRSEMQPR